MFKFQKDIVKMSDTDSDEKSSNSKPDKSKKKRQKSEVGGGGGVSRTYQFEISLSQTNSENYTEVSFLDLVSKEEQRLRKLAEVQQRNGEGQVVGASLDPYASDDDDQLKALAASFESKYGDKPKTKKIGKVGGKKRKHDFDHLGEGYDESDPFIDNSECFDEIVPQEITTAHGGFYINTGALEFKENKNAVFNLSSDEERQPEEKKVKKAKKDPTKKQVQAKEMKDKKKPKVKMTEVKRKARIINTNPNIKGPGARPGPPAVTVSEAVKVEASKVEVERVEAPPSAPAPAPASAPRSPEKPLIKPPDIINLEAQLEALNQSKTIEISKKSESKALGSPKPVPKVSKPSAAIKKVKDTPLSVASTIAELKLPASVRVTKIDDKTVSKSPVSNTTSNKMAWQNQVDFANKLKESPKAAPSVPAETKPKKVPNGQANKPTVSKPQTSNTIIQPVRVGMGVSPQGQGSIQKTSRPGAVSSTSPVSLPSSPAIDTSNMFQHDPKNILASAVAAAVTSMSSMSPMSSVLGTTAPYFAQKLQQKPALDLSSRSGSAQSPKPDSSVSSSTYSRTVPGVSKVQSPAPASPASSGRHSSPSPLYQQKTASQTTLTPTTSPARSNTGLMTKLPSTLNVSTSSSARSQPSPSQMTKLPTTPNISASSSARSNPSQMAKLLTTPNIPTSSPARSNPSQMAKLPTTPNISTSSPARSNPSQMAKLLTTPNISTSNPARSNPSQMTKLPTSPNISTSSPARSNPSQMAKLPTTPNIPTSSTARSTPSQMTKLPTTPNISALDNINTQQVLTPEWRKSLLGLAETMINDIQKQNTSPISNLPKASNVPSLPNTPKIQSLPKPAHPLQQQQQQQQQPFSKLVFYQKQ